MLLHPGEFAETASLMAGEVVSGTLAPIGLWPDTECRLIGIGKMSGIRKAGGLGNLANIH